MHSMASPVISIDLRMHSVACVHVAHAQSHVMVLDDVLRSSVASSSQIVLPPC
jgi:hypothetical protein